MSAPRVSRALLVCLEGAGQLERSGSTYIVGKGEVWLLPAEVGACAFHPHKRRDLTGNCDTRNSSRPGDNRMPGMAGSANCNRKNSKVEGS